MKTFSSNLSFKELCGYGMPISTMFTNGILKADESGTTKIQAPDNAMYNGTSFKTLVAFGLVTEGGREAKDFIVVAGDGNQVSIFSRFPEDDAPGESYPFSWQNEATEEFYTNTLDLEIDSNGGGGQISEPYPLLGFVKGDGSSFVYNGIIPTGAEEKETLIEGEFSFIKVDFRSNDLISSVLEGYGIELDSVLAVWVRFYDVIDGILDGLEARALCYNPEDGDYYILNMEK